MRTVPNTDYVSDQLWLSEVAPLDAVLCKRTALIMLGLITGNMLENHITMYRKSDIADRDFDIQEIHGVCCTTAEQTISDMLNENEMYDAELAEGMANYYFLNNESFEKLPSSARQAKLFDYYCKWAKDFYNER